MMPFLAYFFATVSVLAALYVVSSKHPVHALLAMIVCLLAIAGVFFVIGAPFAGALEIVVYAGAIMVLFVFVVMLLNLGRIIVEREASWFVIEVWLLPAIAAVLVFLALTMGLLQGVDGAIEGTTVGAKEIGKRLYGPYMLLVEAAALILLAALVAAYHLAKRDTDNERGLAQEEDR